MSRVARSRIVLALILAIAPYGVVAADAVPESRVPSPESRLEASLPPDQQARYQSLINELRCLVCQNQTIADSNAPLANDLREQVARQIREGRSDAEIRGYLTDRYGDFVLYRPPLSARTALLWGGPFLLVALALGIALGFVRRSQRRRAAAAAAPAAVDPARLRALLDEDRR